MAHAVVHFEISGPDEAQLAEFYAGLFGWQLRPVPGLAHALVDTCGGAGINGSVARSPDGEASVVFYIQADELQAILDKVNLLGGKTAAPISDLDRIATLAKFEDPDGLVVGLVLGPADPGPSAERQPASGPTGRLVASAALPATGAPGQAAIPGPSAGTGAPVDWFELLGSDATGSQRFYAEIFGWQVTSAASGYGMVDTGSARGIRGGVGGGQEHQWATVYARVPEVDAALAKARQLGGSIEREPSAPAGNGMRTAALRDPAGNVFGVYSAG